jgi:ribosomal protein S18 acetylase RimI-like enzyme
MGTSTAVTIVVAETADAALQQAVARLVPQLSSSSAAPGLDELRRMIEDPATTLLLAVSADADADADAVPGSDASAGAGARSGQVVGMLTLALFLLPTGVRAWIEDVVVDETARGAGVAAALTNAALDHARRFGARTVDLTSRPEREAANRLYARLGFERRETNVYRYTLKG